MTETRDRVVGPPVLALTVEMTAHVLQLGRSKVYELIRRGDLPSVQIDGSRRVRVRDLEEYVARLGRPTAP